MEQNNNPASGRKQSASSIVRDIKRKTRRLFSAEDKIKIVLEGLRVEESVSAICRRYGIHETNYYNWSKDFLEAGKKRLSGDTERNANTSEVKDLRDGQTYKTIQIGNQTWFTEDLRYSGGIPRVTDSVVWNSFISAAWCYYQNDSLNNAAYGKLYNWYAVNEANLCPVGWHVPGRSEWNSFNASLGNTPRFAGINIAQDGCRGFLSEFYNIDVIGYWWSSTPDTGTVAYDWSTSNSGFTYTENTTEKRVGYSVRCIKD